MMIATRRGYVRTMASRCLRHFVSSLRRSITSMISASFTFKRSSIDFVCSSVIFCTCSGATLLVVPDVAVRRAP